MPFYLRRERLMENMHEKCRFDRLSENALFHLPYCRAGGSGILGGRAYVAARVKGNVRVRGILWTADAVRVSERPYRVRGTGRFAA